jgi:hypothetical protein
MPDFAMCLGEPLKLCADCARRTAEPNDGPQAWIEPATRRVRGTTYQCANRVSSPAARRDFARADSESGAGIFSGEAA